MTYAVKEIVGGPTDGSEIIFSPPGIVTMQPIVANTLPYDPAEIETVADLNTFSFGLAVPASHPAQTLDEYAAWV